MVNKQDILTSVKNLDIFLRVPELKGSKARLNNNGNPFVHVGGFNMVFQLTHKRKKWAFRVWHVPMGEHKERYLAIAKYLSKTKLPYFADFIYDENGLLVNGRLIDTIRMEWLDGMLLKEYLESIIINSKKLKKLAEKFLEMTLILRENSISHGDLQDGNILITKTGELKLIDYDSVCIPEIEGELELVTGLKGFQHPSRIRNNKSSLRSDYFSELIIYLSILALSESPNLWDKYQVKDSAYLLFSENDFEDLSNSNIYRDLMSLSSEIQSLIRVLEHYLKEQDFKNLAPFKDTLQSIFKDPKIAYFIADRIDLPNDENNLVKLTWNVSYAHKIELNIENGLLPEKGSLMVPIEKNKEIILTASNVLGKTDEHQIKISVSNEKPVIQEFRFDKKTLTDEEPANLYWEITGAKDVTIRGVGTKLPSKGSKKIHVLNDTKFQLYATSYFGQEIKKTTTLKISKERPIINEFKAELEYVISNREFKIHWNVENAKNIAIRDSEGELIYEGQNLNYEIEKSVDKKTSFFLEAENIFRLKSKKKFTVQTLPIPIIKGILVKTPNLKLDTQINYPKNEIKIEEVSLGSLEFSNDIFFDNDRIDSVISTTSLNIPEFEDKNLLFEKYKIKKLSISDIYQALLKKILKKINNDKSD